MRALGSIWSAFVRASGRQKVVIIAAGLVILGAIGNATTPVPPAGRVATAATPTPAPLVAAPPSLATSVPALTASAEPPAIPTSPPEPTPSPTATPELTPPPTPTPTPKPSPAPTPKPTTFSLSFTSLTTPIYPNQYATAKVRTAAGAYCTIVVEYKSGPSTAAGLGDKTANSSGVASWTWKVGGRTTPGSWPVTVTCSKGGESKSVTRYLDVL